MHYSQKRRYYFFIAITKFKTILSYYPRWRKLSTYCLSFAQPSLMIAPHFHHTCTTLTPHTLANFQSLPKLISCASSPPPLAQASPLLLILRSTFAHPSLKVRLSFVQGSMRRILNFELMGLLGVRAA